ncbi:MAG: glycosyltransferase [Dorea sp.]|jgi:colanic acid/amylovoran biosynthesis glycosyltransferase|nr:glycosyltransferase [Dorea sp.]MCI9453956.1 glycosyltransferase [Dorea sp.]
MKIFLFTNQFPYGEGEIFLAEELEFEKGKNEMYICPVDINTSYSYESNIECIRNIKLTKEMCVTLIKGIICCKPLFTELKLLISKKNIHINTVKKMIVAWIRANLIKTKILQLLNCRSEENEPVILYSYWASHTAIALSLIKKRGVKTLTRLHGIDLFEERHRFHYLPFRNQIFSHIDMICPISEEGEMYIQKKYKLVDIADKCFVSRLGTKDHGRNPYNGSNKELVVVSCSSVIEVKRIHLILDTLKNFQGVKIRWIHFGDGILLKDIKKKAENLNNSMNLKCEFMGYREKEDIMKYYSSYHIDLFLNVSYSEGIPVSIMEAMSFGIPIIATDVGGVKEIVENEKSGWLIHRDKVISDLENTINIYLNLDEKDKINMHLYARKKWESNFVANDNYRKFYELIEECV